jgi:hypothetical protein
MADRAANHDGALRVVTVLKHACETRVTVTPSSLVNAAESPCL